MSNVLFLTWIQHRRTRHLCERLDLPLAELISRHRGLRRYVELTIRTIKTLYTRRPRAVIVQSPSVILTLICLMLRPFFRYQLMIDAHNEAVEPYLHTSAIMRGITHLILKRSDLIIVTNEQLAAVVIGQGGRVLVLPDGIPTPPVVRKKELVGDFKIVLISTFSGDEPFNVVVDTMRQMESDIHLYVTGNPSKLPAEMRRSLPDNITLTGFLDEDDYWSTLVSADAVMDLTTMQNCLVCGAYEAIAVQRPLLLSRNDASVELFSDFAVFTDNTVDGLLEAIATLRSRRDEILFTFPTSRQRFERNWDVGASRLLSLLAEGQTSSPSV